MASRAAARPLALWDQPLLLGRSRRAAEQRPQIKAQLRRRVAERAVLWQQVKNWPVCDDLAAPGAAPSILDKLQEANNKHRQEVAEMEVKLRKMESTKEQISGERATLLEMNTALSGQVSLL